MGRGNRKTSAGVKSSPEDILREEERFIGLWRMRMNSKVSTDLLDLEDLLNAKANGLRKLTQSPEDQRRMIRSVHRCDELVREFSEDPALENKRIAVRAQRLSEQGREMFILCHRGYVDNLVAKHTLRFDSESPERANEILHQACNIALHRTIDRYDFNSGANPLTYATRVMYDEIKKEAEYGRRVRLKSKANALGDKIESLSKKIEDEGREVTIAELSEKLEERPEKIAEILPHARRQTVSLDMGIDSDGEGALLGDMIADKAQITDGEASLMDRTERIRLALEQLPPFEKRVIEIAFDIGDGRMVEQKDLFDGVYKDKSGKLLSPKKSIIRERSQRGEKVELLGQRELNRLYESGEVVYIPGNPEAHSLARAGRGGDPLAPTEREINYKTGTPPTSGVVQEALRKGLGQLRENPLLDGMGMRYRGADELENSEIAREIARQRLLEINAIEEDELSSLLSAKSTTGGKSRLRELAEANGIVDPESGRLL